MNAENAAFFASVISGVVSFALRDFFDAFNNATGSRRFLIDITDFLWWIAMGAAVIAGLWYTNRIEFRFFVAGGFILGVYLYKITISRAVKLCFYGIFKFFFKIVEIILKILLTPARFLYKIIVRPFAHFIRCKTNNRLKGVRV